MKHLSAATYSHKYGEYSSHADEFVGIGKQLAREEQERRAKALKEEEERNRR